MAKHLSKKDIKKIEITNYLSIRDKIETGLLFFTSGNYPISKVIQKATKSPWSHVGILFNVYCIDRIMLLESVEDMGTRFIPFSVYLEQYNGEIVICKVDNLPDIDLNKAFGKGIDRITKRYDKVEFLRIIERIIKGEGKVHENDKDVCSELVARNFKEIHPFNPDKRGFISPKNIWEDKDVELLWRVK